MFRKENRVVATSASFICDSRFLLLQEMLLSLSVSPLHQISSLFFCLYLN